MEIINHGLLPDQSPRPDDYHASGFSFVSFIERNPSGDWTNWLPTKEIQYGKEDSQSCVSFSACNSLEIQYKFLTGTELNFSDRWIAKMSGTTRLGNSLGVVADTVRHYGMVAETSYPAPPNFTFDEYHADIPPDLLAKLTAEGQDFLSKWDIRFEYVSATKDEMMKHIKQSPLQIIIPGHAVVEFLCEQDIADYFDTYNPFQKKTPYNNILYALKYILTPKVMTKRFIVKDGAKIGLLVSEGFTGTITYADTPEHLDFLKKALGFDGTEPTIELPQ